VTGVKAGRAVTTMVESPQARKRMACALRAFATTLELGTPILQGGMTLEAGNVDGSLHLKANIILGCASRPH
jgi:hypothetical protein